MNWLDEDPSHQVESGPAWGIGHYSLESVEVQDLPMDKKAVLIH